MMRFFTFILQIIVLAAVAIWLADRPGTARIVWHDTVIETSAAFLALCALAAAFALHLLWRAWHFLRHGPTHWRLRRRMDKMQKGHDCLTQGLIAIASGNSTEAGRLAVAARKHVGNGIATQWLQAQAAQLAGDTRAAREIFRQLAAQGDAAVLGYRGLITEAKRDGNWAEVDRLMTELHRLKPAVPWLSLIRMESSARRRDWAEAEQALSHAVAARLMDTEAGRRSRAALRIAISRTAALAGSNTEALQAAEQAARQAPDWLPAVINLAEMLAKTQHKRATLRLIERAWKQTPHPQLARILLTQADDALDAYRLTERLCQDSEALPESRIALAEAALAANIWGEARRHLVAAVNDGSANQTIYRLLAKLERREHHDERAALAWLGKAAEAAPDQAWLCRSCSGTLDNWQPICSHCGAFDAVDWQKPGQRRASLPSLCETVIHV